jgi:hypothetical protein
MYILNWHLSNFFKELLSHVIYYTYKIYVNDTMFEYKRFIHGSTLHLDVRDVSLTTILFSRA